MDKKILIADDEKVVRAVLKRTLEGLSYHLFTASDGPEALQMAFLEKPDLIFLDVDMPVKNGWQVIRELRSHAETQMIPVIMLTGKSDPTDKAKGLNSGADDYITKP